jgi:glycosyl transferase family 87
MRLALASLAAAAVLIGGLPRVLLAAGMLPEILRAFTWSDPLFTYLRGLSGHRLPYFDGLYEYPPVLGFAAGVFSWLAPNAAWYVVAWTIVLALCAAATAHLLAPSASVRRVVAVWALAPQLVLLGSLNFDLVAVVFLVGAIVCARTGRSLTATVLLGFGGAAKLFPAAALPAAVTRVRKRGIAVALFGAVVVGLTIPTMFAASSAISGVVYYAGLGTNLDSPWGILARVLAAMGIAVPAADGIVLVITLAGLVVTYALALRYARAEPAVACGLAILAVMLWTRRYSPQYSLWILPTLVLTPVPGRTIALLAIADTVVFLAISPLTLVSRGSPTALDIALLGALTAAVVLRHAALVMIWGSLIRSAKASLAGAAAWVQTARQADRQSRP